MALLTPVSTPGPRRVVRVDLDAPLPELVADDRGVTALVVGYRDGHPVTTLDVALTDDPADAGRAIAALAAGPAGSPVGSSDGLHAGSSVVPTGSIAGTSAVPDTALPSVSVVVSTIVTRLADIARLLDHLAALDYPSYEVVVVDNRVAVPAEDPLPGLLAGHDVRLVVERRPGCSAGRNAGVAAATGEVVAFTDDDVRVDPRWLRMIGTRFVQEPELDAVTGMILPAELETPAQIWYEAYYGGFSGERTFDPLTLVPEDAPGALRHARVSAVAADGSVRRRFPVYGVGGYGAGANWAVRRSVFDRVGGFDPVLGAGVPARGGEDLAMFIDVLWRGGRIGVEPRAVVHHRHRPDLAGLHGQLHANGVGFTALLCALVSADRRHLAALVRLAPPAARAMAGRVLSRLVRRGSATATTVTPSAVPPTRVPRSLAFHELRGFPAGPAAWLRSRRAWREVERTHTGA